MANPALSGGAGHEIVVMSKNEATNNERAAVEAFT
jgi:hypothetical protein